MDHLGWNPCSGKTRLVTSVAGLLAVLAVVACAPPLDESPIVGLELAVSPRAVAHGGVVKIAYRVAAFQPVPPSDEPFRVHTHFMDADGQLMWADEHLPPTPVARVWPGTFIRYTRTLFLPYYPYLGEVSVRAGVYSPDHPDGLPLVGREDSAPSDEVARLTLLPQSESIQLAYGSGWYPLAAADGTAVSRWTEEQWSLSFQNPGRDARFYIEVQGRPDVAETPAAVEMLVDRQTVGTFPLASAGRTIHEIPLEMAHLGTADVVELTFQVNRSYGRTTSWRTGRMTAGR